MVVTMALYARMISWLLLLIMARSWKPIGLQTIGLLLIGIVKKRRKGGDCKRPTRQRRKVPSIKPFYA